MILKGNQRGGGRQLALHLLNAGENEHVHVHELRGLTSDDLEGAFKECLCSQPGDSVQAVPILALAQPAARCNV